MSKLKLVLIVVALIASVSTAQYFLGPKRVIIKTKEVIKIVEVVDTDIIIIENKDGSKVTKIKKRSKRQSETTKASSREVILLNKKWLLGVSSNLSNQTYSAHASRRILGNIYLGGYVSTGSEFGLSITLQF